MNILKPTDYNKIFVLPNNTKKTDVWEPVDILNTNFSTSILNILVVKKWFQIKC